ncbi:synaptonemal complex protein 3-like [Hydra vulgaris]|uniref:Synaptonemal complex protein 3 n=1 Tax=Hydra vulgaris TaxID=6087 RepID=J9SPZ8_HYDVU|nr:synaptonemal complex protein 3-like [Hydra vulgaris]AFR54108.1 synaptonemal complex protein 3 [Hydra vulgaris]
MNDKKKSKQTKGTFELGEEKSNITSDEAPTLLSKSSLKRKASKDDCFNESDDEEKVEDNDTEGVGESEVNSLLHSFGADISKSLTAKRKQLAMFTEASLKTSNRKYEEIFIAQQSERNTINEEFNKQICSVLGQWETDILKTKEGDEKLEAIFRQLQKSLQQQRVVQNQRLKSLKTLHEHYTKSVTELAKVHRDQQTNIHVELRKELSSLRKKMIDGARNENFSNIRKSLQSLLHSV